MSKFKKVGLKKTVIALIITVVVITGGMAVYINGIGAADPDNSESITVTIPSGSGASAIVDILDENGLVKNSAFAKIHVRIGGYDSLQAGTYIFNKTMPLSEIMKAINTGDMDYISKQEITVIEGVTIPQTAEAVASELPFTKEEVLAVWSDREYLGKLIDSYWFLTDDILQEGIMYPLEGYLYPETYFVRDEETSVESVTEMMLDKMDEELTARKDDIEKSGRSVHEFLTLSSIVENESLFEEDRPKIAGVFINRLNAGMPLQSDITVLYALQEKRVDVTYDDLEVDSKYNTYKNTGLPVGPVCAVPGHTMDDVLDYTESDYLFFFATEDGKVIYSKTVEEHNKVVEENAWY